MEGTGLDRVGFPLALQAVEQYRVALRQLLGDAEQDDVLGRPVTGEFVASAGDFRLGGLAQGVDQGFAGDDREAVILGISPVAAWPFGGLAGVERQFGACRRIGNVAAHLN